MPTATENAYRNLLADALPSVIESERQYDSLRRRLSDLTRMGPKRSASETKLMRLLALLIEDYDARHRLPKDPSSPSERLRYVMEMSGRSTEDLHDISTGGATRARH